MISVHVMSMFQRAVLDGTGSWFDSESLFNRSVRATYYSKTRTVALIY